MTLPFADHFSAVAVDYANARPDYPDRLFAWIASVAPSRAQAWDAGCGSGQASRGLAAHFQRVFATDPAAAQIAQATAPGNVRFAVEPAERCSLPDASVDAVCVAQALHWFDRERFFAECDRVLRPGGVLVAWGYQDIEVPTRIAGVNAEFQQEIAGDWPPERAWIDSGYAEFHWPFAQVAAPELTLDAEWTLPRLLGYFSSYSASRRYRERSGHDPVVARAAAFAAAWGDPGSPLPVSWPLFIHARRKGA